MSKSYYEILQVSKDADERAIKKAYHGLALKLHPDKAKDDAEKAKLEEQFGLITTAYNTLKDAEARKAYDELLAKGGGTVAMPAGQPSAGGVVAPAPTGGAPKDGGAKAGAAPVQTSGPEQEKGRKEVAKRAFAQGIKLMQLNEFDRAVEFLRTAVKSDDSEALYHHRLALALLRTKKSFSEAVTAAKRACDMDPYKPDYKYNLAELYEAIGSKDKAEKVYEELLRLDPENTLAMNRLSEKRRKAKENPMIKLWKKFVGRE